MMVPKIVSHAASDVAQNERDRIRALGRGLVRNVSDILHQPSFQAAPQTCSVHVWRGDRVQRKVIVLKIMSHCR